MTIRARRAAKTDRAALALAGLGAADADKRHFVTSLTRTPPNNADHLVSPPRPDKDRLQRNIYACSEPFECDPFAADMLARAYQSPTAMRFSVPTILPPTSPPRATANPWATSPSSTFPKPERR